LEEIQKRKQKQITLIILLIGLTIFIALLSISLGSVNIEMREVLKIIAGSDNVDKTQASIVLNIRLPRVLATIIGGACLAVSGLLLQIFFKNPIVEPYILGISSGASLFVGLVILGGYSFGIVSMSPMGLFLGAFMGAMLVMVIVVLAARKVKSITTLLIIGMMAGFICNAMTGLLTAFADKEQLQGFVMWTLGSFSGFSWSQVKFLYLVGLPMIILSYGLSKPLNAMLFGENYAISMGLSIRRFRMLVIVIASILTAAITAFAGPISFVGLAVPHMVRMSFGTSDNRVLIPGVIFAGALMTGICDLLARMLLAPIELSLSVLTSVIGAPIVVYLLLKKKKGDEI
jgi:iron complex transport system permease protein